MRFLTRVFIAVYLVEAGLILVAAPWTSWWQRNYFAELLPWLRATMATHTMQVTVVAIGVITAAVGASDLWLAFSGRHTRRLSSPDAQDS